VPSISEDLAARELENGVRVVSLGMAPSADVPPSFDPLWIGTATEQLRKHGVGPVDWYIGHDVVSGAAANQFRDQTGQGRSGVIMHMSYRDYQGLKHGSAQEANRKYEIQRKIFEHANKVLAVGPLLRDRATDMIEGEVTMVVPGLPGIRPRPPRAQLVVLSFGRFEPKNDRIKQVRLAVAGFAEACRLAGERAGGPKLLSDAPLLKLLGVSGRDEEIKLQTLAQETAGAMLNVQSLPYEDDRGVLHRHIAESNIALMLSWHEGFGLTGWEAIDAELPLIVSVRSGLYKLLEENGLAAQVHPVTVSGHLGDPKEEEDEPNFTPEDRARVANKILEIAADLAGARRRAQELKNALVQREFTWASAARTVLAALDVRPNSEPSGSASGKATSPEIPPTGAAGTNPGTTAVASGTSPATASPPDDLLDPKELTWSAPFDPPESVLLRAEYQVVPFHDARAPVLEELLTWAERPAKPISLRLHTGDGGSGKTRLAIELCRRLRAAGWDVGFLPEGTETARISRLLARSTNCLVVIDYAETRRRDITSVVRAALSMPKGHRLRVLLLARAAGDWWNRLADDAGDKTVAAVLVSPDYTIGPYPLPPLVLADDQRERVFREALAAFAIRIDKDPEGVASPSLSAAHFADALFVHLAALCALRGERLESAPALLDMSVGRERAYWVHAASNEGLPGTWLDGIEQAASMLVLANGAPSAKEARALIAAAPRLRGLSPLQHDQVIDLLRRIYPQRGGLDALRPDLLGERLVQRSLVNDDGLLEAAFGSAAPERWTRAALAVLTRLARHGEREATWLRQALEGDRLVRLTRVAVDVSIEIGDPLPHAVSEAVKAAPTRTQRRVVPDLRIQIPKETVALQDLAVTVAEIWLGFQREKNVDKNRGKRADLAEAHRELGVRLRKAGHPDHSKRELENSLRLFRSLDVPASVAASCNSLALTLTDLGLHGEALQATREAEGIFKITQKDPRNRASWATTLDNLAINHARLGQYDDALNRAHQAEQIRHQLAESRPDAYRPDWALSLSNLASHLSDVGQYDDALTYARRAEQIRRQLAESHPDAYRPNWATSLGNLASHLRNVGQYDDALTCARQAEQIHRQLAESRPDAYRADLALSLNNLAAILCNVGQ
jgi:tetratricopeptide (TPR) repeat protein